MYTPRPHILRGRIPPPLPAESVPPIAADRNPWHEPLPGSRVFPDRIFGPQASLRTGSREAALIRAVLDDALACFQGQFGTEGWRARRIAREAEEWFFSDDDQWIFSFMHVCAVLGLEPESIRQELKRRSQSHPNTPQR